MDRVILGEDIKNKSFPRLYFLYGGENFIIDFYVEKIIAAALTEEEQVFDLHRHEGKEFPAGEFLSEMEGLPMVAEKKVVAVRDLPPSSETAKTLLSNPGLLNDDTLLLLYTSRDRCDRTKKEWKDFLAFMKKYGKTALLDPMDRTDRERWVKKHFRNLNREISAADTAYFLDSIDNDMYAMASEIEKLVAYTDGKNTVGREDIDRVCIKTADAKIYELVNAITEKEPEKALRVIKTLFDNGENENLISAALFNAISLIYRTERYCAEGMTPSQIAQKTGGRDFVVRKNIALIRTLPKGSVEAMLELCAKTDLLMKTGSISPQILIEELALSCIAVQRRGAAG